MKKIIALLLFSILTTFASRADVLFQDSTNYPYTNGCIEGQGQWYCYSPLKTTNFDALVTNNVLLLVSTNHDEVCTPTNGWANISGSITYASFSINITSNQLPSFNGSWFGQFQNINDTNDCCHLFASTQGTVVPGTYRLGIANFATSYASLSPPVYFPLDLAPGITYNVVVAYDTDVNSPTVGATLMINPSYQDYQNFISDADGMSDTYYGQSYIYPFDTTTSAALLNIVISQIGFSPYINAGISNVIAGTEFTDVNSTNLPVFGIQPQSGTNYSGNSTTFYAAASGVDLTYQWYSATTGILSDNADIVGSQSNMLVLNNLSGSDNYYVVATDAYGNTATSVTATNSVITTPTAPFFAEAPLNLTNNLFFTTGITNPALGTGPLFYQWYFAPANTTISNTIINFTTSFAQLAGQTNSTLLLNLADYTYQGSYFVVASNAIGGGSIAFGPTNNLTELAPNIATMFQLHNLLIASSNLYASKLTGSYYINSNNVTVSGYVTTYGTTTYNGFGSSYSEFYIQNGGYGVEVYEGTGTTGYPASEGGNTNTPPVGTYVTISAPLEVYHGGLQMTPLSLAAAVTNVAPIQTLTPRLCNYTFNDLATNFTGTNSMLTGGSLVTFTNVYIYGGPNGQAFGADGTHSGVGGIFYSNSYSYLYFTVGSPYNAVSNTNTIEIYQFAYNYPSTGIPFAATTIGGQPIPTHCYQLTGVYNNYGTTPEFEPSRIQDYVINPPSAPTVVATRTKNVTTLSWPVQTGSTYSVYSATNLNGPWLQTAYGLGYYPATGTYADTNSAPVTFYRVSTP